MAAHVEHEELLVGKLLVAEQSADAVGQDALRDEKK